MRKILLSSRPSTDHEAEEREISERVERVRE